MGADFREQEKAVEEVWKLSPEARSWVGHHFRNSLCAISYLNELGEKDKIKEAIRHMEEDLNMFGL